MLWEAHYITMIRKNFDLEPKLATQLGRALNDQVTRFSQLALKSCSLRVNEHTGGVIDWLDGLKLEKEGENEASRNQKRSASNCVAMQVKDV
jgi:hypothetical protein